MKTELMIKESLRILSEDEIAVIKGGQSEEETYDGGTMDEVIVTPPPTKENDIW